MNPPFFAIDSKLEPQVVSHAKSNYIAGILPQDEAAGEDEEEEPAEGAESEEDGDA